MSLRHDTKMLLEEAVISVHHLPGLLYVAHNTSASFKAGSRNDRNEFVWELSRIDFFSCDSYVNSKELEVVHFMRRRALGEYSMSPQGDSPRTSVP